MKFRTIPVIICGDYFHVNICAVVQFENGTERKNGGEAADHPLLNKMDGSQQTTLDLSKKGLKKVPKQDDAQNIKILILDDNDLQKIDNIDSYLRIEKV